MKKQFFKIANIHKVLPFSLVMSLLLIGGAKTYAQSFTKKEHKKIATSTAEKKCPEETIRLNKVIAVNDKGILIQDCITQQERIIQPIVSLYSQNCIRLSTLRKHHWTSREIRSNLWPVVFRPGDTIAVTVKTLLIPGQYEQNTGSLFRPQREYAHYADEYYDQNNVLPSVCIMILVPNDDAFLARLQESLEQTDRFDTLKGRIINDNSR